LMSRSFSPGSADMVGIGDDEAKGHVMMMKEGCRMSGCHHEMRSGSSDSAFTLPSHNQMLSAETRGCFCVLDAGRCCWNSAVTVFRIVLFRLRPAEREAHSGRVADEVAIALCICVDLCICVTSLLMHAVCDACACSDPAHSSYSVIFLQIMRPD